MDYLLSMDYVVPAIIIGAIAGLIIGLPDAIEEWKAFKKKERAKRKKQEQKAKGFISYHTPKKKRTLAEILTPWRRRLTTRQGLVELAIGIFAGALLFAFFALLCWIIFSLFDFVFSLIFSLIYGPLPD